MESKADKKPTKGAAAATPAAKTSGNSVAGQKVDVFQTRSGTGHPAYQRRTLAALGLGRIGKSKTHTLTSSTLGMLRSVSHLVVVKHAE